MVGCAKVFRRIKFARDSLTMIYYKFNGLVCIDKNKILKWPGFVRNPQYSIIHKQFGQYD